MRQWDKRNQRGVMNSRMFFANNVGSRYVTPIGGLLSLTIADSTAIDVQSSIGTNGAGWVAICVLKGITSLVGTVVPSQLTLTVSDPGYDTSGNATTVSRTITGVAHMRRQYSNGASKMISTDGTDLTLYITLDDWIYSGTTIVSASIGATFYTGCTASTAGTKTNSSNLAYTKPLFGWINPHLERATASTYTLEGVAFHRHATAGQQVACIKYGVTDGTHTSADVTVSATSTSARITQGNIPEVWSGAVDMSTMTQAAQCTVNAKVYPWLGDSTAVLDLSVSGASWPSSLPQTKLQVICDRTGGYGGAYAYVNVGASGGTVSATAATAKADPYPTISAAMTALKAWNNTNKGHNDLGGGTIRLMDNSGADQTHTLSGNTISTYGSCWCELEKDPASSAVVSVTWSAQSQTPQLMRWRNLKIVTGAAVTYGVLGFNESRSMICLDGCTIDNTNNKTVMAWFAMKYLYNLTLTGSNVCLFSGLPSATANIAIMAGCTSTVKANSSGNDQPKLMIGNSLVGASVFKDPNATGDGDHGRIIYNNRLYQAAYVNTGANTINSGFANVQNLYDTDTALSNAIAMNYFADSDLTTITNYVEFHNTAVGNRCNRMYNDVAGSKVIPNGVPKLGVSRYNIWDNYNIKADTFSSGAGSVGGMAYMYSVGNVGNVSLFGNVQRLATDAPHNDNADSPYLGNAWLSSSEYNLFRTALGFSQAQIMAMFNNYLAAPKASPAIGGDYIPLNTATYLKSRVPSGKSVLKKDIAGTTRYTDGTGAAGCYEAP